MKGLLIKDYKLLMLQKKTFLLMLLIAICMNFAMQDNPGVIIGYLTFFAALMANTTLSYDEYGNGITFLLTLPVTRKTYVRSKYVGNLLLLLFFWLPSTLLEALIYALQGRILFRMETMVSVLAILPVSLIFVDFMIPLVLRFGQEKGKLVWAAVGGLIFAVIAVLNALSEAGKLEAVKQLLGNLVQHGILLTVCIIVLSLLGLAVSYGCSVKVMEKKIF
ncbi:MAG: ABC-2 transporter permease [Lachnospiraceae bacterium]|nr:ABC-2 transporter permease [Bacillota bacterium]MDY3771357.1 ABC-2 transporter permease [Lachnospiraceae bacterium]